MILRDQASNISQYLIQLLKQKPNIFALKNGRIHQNWQENREEYVIMNKNRKVSSLFSAGRIYLPFGGAFEQNIYP